MSDFACPPALRYSVSFAEQSCVTDKQALEKCDIGAFRATIFFMMLITNTSTFQDLNKRIRLINVFTEKQGDEYISSGLLNAEFDIFGVYQVMQFEENIPKFHHLLRTKMGKYSMYTGANWVTTSSSRTDQQKSLLSWMQVFIEPLSVQTWILLLISVLVFSVLLTISQSASSSTTTYGVNARNLTNHILKLVALMLEFALIIYESNLKAKVIVSVPEVPFRSLNELTDQISRGERMIFVENPQSIRYKLLASNYSDEYPEFKRLRNVISADPARNLHVVKDVKKICDQLIDNPKAVFFGYDNLIGHECPRHCFWSYEINSEYPTYLASLWMSKNATPYYLRYAGLFIHAADAFDQQILNRQKLYQQCDQTKIEFNLIGAKSIGCTLILISACYAVAFAVLVVERCWKRYSVL